MKSEAFSEYSVEQVLDTYLRATKYLAIYPRELKDDRKTVKKMKKDLNDGDFARYFTEIDDF